MACWDVDDIHISVVKIENGYILNSARYFRTKKELIKHINKLLQEME